MSPTPSLTLSDEPLALIRRGVSAIVASASLEQLPSVMRAVGTAVDEAGTLFTVYLARSQAGELLRDIAATGRMAVVYSQPSTHRTVQLKTRQVRLREATPEDRPRLDRYAAAMEAELAPLGFGAAYVRAMLAWQPDDLVVIDFVPEEGFDQTPGARAGRPLEPRS